MSDKPLDLHGVPDGSTMHVIEQPPRPLLYVPRAEGDPISSGVMKSQGLSWEDSLKAFDGLGIRNATARAVRPDPRSGFDPSFLPVYPEDFRQNLLELKPLPGTVTGRVAHTPEGFEGWPGVNASPNLPEEDSPA